MVSVFFQSLFLRGAEGSEAPREAIHMYICQTL